MRFIMVCKYLLLPALAIGLAFNSPETFARSANLSNLANSHQQQIHFVENKGQIVNQYQQQRPDIDFRLSAGTGLNIFIGSGKIHYQWARSLKENGGGKGKTPGFGLSTSEENADAVPTYKMYRMDVALIGANTDAKIITEKQESFYERYYLPNMGENGTIAHTFNKITYKNVYPNIDWVLYVKGNTVEYDFVVRPGGKVSDIKLKYDGTATIKIIDGSLSATTPLGSITERPPYSFQQDGKVVASRFVLDGDLLSFSTDEYSGVLTIDPTVEWGTYFGGLGNDQPTKIASDGLGNIYISGGTTSLDNIATSGSHQSIYGGASSGSYIMGDAFLAKFNSSGDCLWSTYYGGTLEDRGMDMDIDKNSQSIYLAGCTQSTTGISTTGAHHRVVVF